MWELGATLHHGLPLGITIPQHTTPRLSIARSLAGEFPNLGLDTTDNSFNGSSVQLLGSLYSDHGNYTVTYVNVSSTVHTDV
jgi:hypothetical protein